ncbi:hypothetical protein KR50_02840 [Jeotgalibacillus campisalis]|uniref:Uncharacterized protein n=2 Tax=Jeotgalibacillus campisalis TaxID=220754 RepID=A0A0C2RRT7_9BACL|nr:hypothetical protein KR50_02840 [Jeotgalibacillus campisalis]
MHILISIILFIGGLMLLNLLINKIMPLEDYPITHPIRIVGYLLFILFLLSTVTALSSLGGG